MASMWRRTMLFLGLGPDDEYDDYDVIEEPPSAPPPTRYAAPDRYAPPEPPDASGVRPLQRDPDPSSLAVRRTGVVRPITPQAPHPKPNTVSPDSFTQAQEIADKFMAGVPVIVNLQGAERELSRRLVDFASGLCYGTRGQMERVTNQVYLITPSNVEVSAEDKRRLRQPD